MSIIFDTLRSYASRCQDHQSPDGTDNTVYNQRACKGIGYKVGNDSTAITDSVTFPITYDNTSDLIVIVSFLGAVSTGGGAPTDISDFNTRLGVAINVATEDVTTSGCNIRFDTDATNFSSGFYFGYSWLAIGTYNDY